LCRTASFAAAGRATVPLADQRLHRLHPQLAGVLEDPIELVTLEERLTKADPPARLFARRVALEHARHHLGGARAGDLAAMLDSVRRDGDKLLMGLQPQGSTEAAGHRRP